MNLSLDGFCEVVKNLSKTNAERALAVLWYFDHEQPGIAKTSGQLTKGARRSSHWDAEPNRARRGNSKDKVRQRVEERLLAETWLTEDNPRLVAGFGGHPAHDGSRLGLFAGAGLEKYTRLYRRGVP